MGDSSEAVDPTLYPLPGRADSPTPPTADVPAAE